MKIYLYDWFFDQKKKLDSLGLEAAPHTMHSKKEIVYYEWTSEKVLELADHFHVYVKKQENGVYMICLSRNGFGQR
jgi:hypothetical protein